MANGETHRRSRRLELRATPEERDLIGRAMAGAAGRTTFVVINAVEAARRVWGPDRVRAGCRGSRRMGGRQPSSGPGPTRAAPADAAALSVRRLNRRYDRRSLSVPSTSSKHSSAVPQSRPAGCAATPASPRRWERPGYSWSPSLATGVWWPTTRGAWRTSCIEAAPPRVAKAPQVSPAGRPAGPTRGGCPPRRARSRRRPSPGRVRPACRAV